MDASGRYSLISSIGISVLQDFRNHCSFDLVRKLSVCNQALTRERVARLSLPYLSIRLTAPQIPRPAPSAITSVCSTPTALVKNAIFVFLLLPSPAAIKYIPEFQLCRCLSDLLSSCWFCPVTGSVAETEDELNEQLFLPGNKESSRTFI